VSSGNYFSDFKMIINRLIIMIMYY